MRFRSLACLAFVVSNVAFEAVASADEPAPTPSPITTAAPAVTLKNPAPIATTAPAAPTAQTAIAAPKTAPAVVAAPAATLAPAKVQEPASAAPAVPAKVEVPAAPAPTSVTAPTAAPAPATPLTLRQEGGTAEAPATPGSGMTAKLLLALAVAAGGVWVWKKKKATKGATSSNGTISVLDRTALRGGGELLVVKVEGTKILVGMNGHAISTLAFLGDHDEAVPSEEAERKVDVGGALASLLGNKPEPRVTSGAVSRESRFDDEDDALARLEARARAQGPADRVAATRSHASLPPPVVEGQIRGLASLSPRAR